MCTDTSSVDPRVWTKRQRLTFPDLSPGVQFNLPLFLLHSDSDKVALADGDGELVACCVDPVYEAIDHQLLWLRHYAEIYLYCEQENRGEPQPLDPQYQDPENVLLLADFFREPLCEILQRWQLRAESASAAGRISSEFLESLADARDDRSIEGAPCCGPVGQAVKLDTAAGYLALVRSPSQPIQSEYGRVHLRVHLFDDGVARSSLGHWLGFKSSFGSVSIGLCLGIEDCYSFLNGHVPTGESGQYHGWQRTSVERCRGWHLFELVLEDGAVAFSVDNEPVASTTAEGFCDTAEVWLVSRCGGEGVWAGVELFYTPLGGKSWEMGVQRLTQGERRPWLVGEEEGRWQADEAGIVRNVKFDLGAFALITSHRQCLIDSFSRVSSKYMYNPLMDAMLGQSYRVLKINPDGMVGLKSLDGSNDGIWWFPPIASALAVVDFPVAPATIEYPAEVVAPIIPPPVPTTGLAAGDEARMEGSPASENLLSDTNSSFTIGGIAIECWSVHGEEDVVRIERAMTAFVEALQGAQVAMPENIARIHQCQAVPAHANCFVYSFGTRRVHVATRVTDTGRLLLVVRCGGGFIDFVDFVRRHGSIEQIRLHRQPASQGRAVVRFTSVLSKGQVRAVPRTGARAHPGSGLSRPSSSPARPATTQSDQLVAVR